MSAPMHYAFPDPLDSEDAARKRYHLDIPNMPALLLLVELQDVMDALRDAVHHGTRTVMRTPDGYPLSPLDWLHERYTRLKFEEERRSHEKR